MPSEDPSEPSSDAESDDFGEDSITPDESEITTESTRREELSERLGAEADRAVEEFDQRLVDLLSWLLDTETRARIYVHLRKHPDSTSEEIAEGTGLYPSTVREALAELTDEDVVERHKRESEGAGNNPYEYTAIPPSDLVGSVAGQIQQELNAVFNLDRHLEREDPDTEPVTITVESGADSEDDFESDSETAFDADSEIDTERFIEDEQTDDENEDNSS